MGSAHANWLLEGSVSGELGAVCDQTREKLSRYLGSSASSAPTR
jgi:hypothetical protein